MCGGCSGDVSTRHMGHRFPSESRGKAFCNTPFADALDLGCGDGIGGRNFLLEPATGDSRSEENIGMHSGMSVGFIL